MDEQVFLRVRRPTPFGELSVTRKLHQMLFCRECRLPLSLWLFYLKLVEKVKKNEFSFLLFFAQRFSATVVFMQITNVKKHYEKNVNVVFSYEFEKSLQFGLNQKITNSRSENWTRFVRCKMLRIRLIWNLFLFSVA